MAEKTVGKKRRLEDLQRVTVRSREDLQRWLQANHRQSESIWVVTFKKRPGSSHVPYADIVDEALCFGWIDSLPRKLDDERSMLLLSPRKAGSAWSAVNKAKIAKLARAGRIMPAGAAKIAAARKDGSWTFLDDVEALLIPDDLAAALATDAKALSGFTAFNRSSKRGILEWIKQARRAETRVRRIAETVRLAALGLRAAHPADVRKSRFCCS